MKLTIVLLLAACLHVSAKVVAQQVTIRVRNMPLKEVLGKIKQQTGYHFIYNDKDIDRAGAISLDLRSVSVSEALEAVCKDQPLTYSIEKNTVFISARPVNTPPSQATSADNAEGPVPPVRGRIVNENGEPASGVSISIKGGGTIGVTDEKGEFLLSNLGSDVILVFTAVNMETYETKLNGRRLLVLNMTTKMSRLDETVVIAYGTSTRKALTGSVSTVSSKTIEEQPVGNVLSALEGRMAGVNVTQTNGLPNSGVSIQIRGQTSIASGTDPLYVVDGVPFNFNLSPYYTASNGQLSPFNSLNPSDIESIDVLKDADATAIYGARGGNGVILITTKKGKAGKTNLNVNVRSGEGKVGHFIDMLSGEQYLQLRKEAFANDNVTPTTTNAPDLTTWSQTSFRNWQKDLIGGTSHYTDAQASLSGGSEKTHFVFSPGYHHEGTVYPGSFGEDRISGRLGVDHSSLDNRLKVLISAAYSYDKENIPTTDLSSSYSLAPNYNPYTSTGAFNYVSGLVNPYATLAQKFLTNTSNVIANMTIRYTILKGLDLKANLGYTTLTFNQHREQPAATINPFSAAQISNAVFATTDARSYILEPQAEYNRSIFKGKLNVLGGMTFQQNLSQTNSILGTNYSNDALLGSMAGAGTLSSIVAYDKYKFNSIFGRLNYNWEGKYIINGTIRRDGSSRFGGNNQFGNFGAVGAAWIFTEESFAKNALSFLSFGKLRGSYGITGNDQISNYQYLSTYTAGSTTAAYQGTAIQNPSRLANPNIQWESNKKAEAALDLGFFKNKLLFTAAVYRNLMGNELLYISTPGQVGFTSYLGNFPATIRNQGLELELNSTNIQTSSFKWTTAFNISIAKTKLIQFDNLAAETFYSNSYRVGYPVPFALQYVATGVNPTTGVITYQTKNANGLPTYATDEIPTPLGNPYYGGLTNTFTYKQFDLGFFIQFKHQKGYINSINTTLGSMVNQNTSTLDHWRQAGDISKFPGASATAGKAIYNAYSFYYNSSTALYGDASWVKLRNVNLGYNFSKQLLAPIRMSNLRIYAQGQNLFVLSKFKNSFDPETGTVMPALRTLVIGLNASF